MSELHVALLALKGNPDFKVVIKHLEGELEKAHTTCLKADGVSLSRAQGRGSFIQDLLTQNTDARKVVDNSK